MPPKRKQNVVDIITDSELEVESEDELDINNSLKFLQKVEGLAKKRNDKRNAITAAFDKYVDDMKEKIERHYTSKAEERSTKIKNLLTRRAEALERQAAIEREIEAVLSESRESTRDIMVVLEALYVERQQRISDATGSFASLVPKRAPPTNPIMTPPSAMDKRTFDLLTGGQNFRGEEGHAHNGSPTTKDAKPQRKWQRKADFFDDIAW